MESFCDKVVTEQLWGKGLDNLLLVKKQLQDSGLSYEVIEDSVWQVNITGKQVLIEGIKGKAEYLLPIQKLQLPPPPPGSIKIDVTWTFYHDCPDSYQSRLKFTETAIRQQIFNTSKPVELVFYLRKMATQVTAICSSDHMEKPVLSIWVEIDPGNDNGNTKNKVISTIKHLWSNNYCVTEKQFLSEQHLNKL